MARQSKTQGNGRVASATQRQAVSRDEIALVAYELFEQRGCGHGHDQDDWLEAERIVRQRKRTA